MCRNPCSTKTETLGWTHPALGRWDSGAVLGRYVSAYLVQMAVQPPSIENSMPVTKLEASLASHNAALATSSGVPSRFMGLQAARPARSSSGTDSTSSGVSIKPGQMALIRMPDSPYSTAVFRVRPPTAYLEATYSPAPEKVVLLSAEAMLMICQVPIGVMILRLSRIHSQTPLRLIPINRS